jgi:2-keto-4-pentenoate hydratase
MTPENVAVQFVEARLAGRSIANYPEGAVPPDLATAYRTQDVAISRWPDEIRGWKVARIGAQWQQQYPEERLIGPVFSRNFYEVTEAQVAVCPIFDGGFAAVEAEIGIHVLEDAPVRKTDWTADTASVLVADVRIGVEVASSPLATLNDLGPGAVVSDFGNNWGVIVGAPIADWSRATALGVETFIDGESVGTGTVVISNTLSALAFALNKAAQRGRPLRKGDYISTGMITGVHDIRVGQQSRLVFEGCGEILCRMVRVEAHVSGAR